MIKQGYQNGKWNAIVFKKNPKSLSIRHIIPLLFVLGIIGCILLGLITPFFWYVLLIVLVLHLILGVVFALQKTKKLSYILTMPIMFMLLHISYGAGTLINSMAYTRFVGHTVVR
jgi:hydrogenase/urease accessory protein HupE